MENWKLIKGFEDYEVSELGRVRRRTPARGTVVGKVLRPCIDKRGRLMLGLNDATGKRHPKLLHKFVASAFIPNPNNLPEVNHLKTLLDCKATDLEWRTKAGNELYVLQKQQRGLGVLYEKRRHHWIAYYHVGRRIYVGSFSTKRAALKARQTAVKNLKEVV